MVYEHATLAHPNAHLRHFGAEKRTWASRLDAALGWRSLMPLGLERVNTLMARDLPRKKSQNLQLLPTPTTRHFL